MAKSWTNYSFLFDPQICILNRPHYPPPLFCPFLSSYLPHRSYVGFIVCILFYTSITETSHCSIFTIITNQAIFSIYLEWLSWRLIDHTHNKDDKYIYIYTTTLVTQHSSSQYTNIVNISIYERKYFLQPYSRRRKWWMHMYGIKNLNIHWELIEIK